MLCTIYSYSFFKLNHSLILPLTSNASKGLLASGYTCVLVYSIPFFDSPLSYILFFNSLMLY